ncbi:MAG: lipoprotein-releasing system transmembrane subunit, LolC/LolE family, partial [Planctomycetes bacterium]|nr:lipoprotein-releasing system transmembrane subunit, LolC/LolE family [Planctomycetota bacterium]
IVFAGLGSALLLHRGTLIWDPSVYYFSEIPNSMDVVTAVTTMIGAVIFSVLGAFIPAMKAADTDPVRALRYE